MSSFKPTQKWNIFTTYNYILEWLNSINCYLLLEESENSVLKEYITRNLFHLATHRSEK